MSAVGFLGGAVGRESTCQFWRCKKHRFDLWVEKTPWRRKWQPTPVFLPGKYHGQRRLVSYNPRDHKESDTTEHTYAHTHTHEFKVLYRCMYLK